MAEDIRYPSIADQSEDMLIPPVVPVSVPIQGNIPGNFQQAPQLDIHGQGVELPEERTEKEEKQEPIIYEVKPQDTLDGIAIKFGVSKNRIRVANAFLGDEIYQFKTLKIPSRTGQLYADVEMDEEAIKKRDQLKLMIEVMENEFKNEKKKADYSKEAKFYLESSNWDFQRAMKQFAEDMKWEREYEKQNKNHKAKHHKYYQKVELNMNSDEFL
eukprot:TRINITY_DN26855_c0_g1_i1.p1 TRINITY_DN26855_c0_g1~~TRINITY_DN26855_c0_g1_i1.p1  ORF type:complete len:214 (-),score=35.35 TRINITY_DN26855_c0_g1_i1:4-645(-)